MLFLQELAFVTRKTFVNGSQNVLRRLRSRRSTRGTFTHAHEHAGFVLAVILYFRAAEASIIERATHLLDRNVLLELKLYFGSSSEVDSELHASRERPYDTR